MANFTADSSAVILTALYPEDGAPLYARFCNYSDQAAKAAFTPAVGKITGEVLGNELATSNGEMDFHPCEIKTIRIES